MTAFFWANTPCLWDGRQLHCQYPAFLLFAIAVLEASGGGHLAVPLGQVRELPVGECVTLPESVRVVGLPFYQNESEVIRRFRSLAAGVWRARSLIRASDVIFAVSPGIVGNFVLEIALASGRPAAAIVRGSKKRSLAAIYSSGFARRAYQAAALAMDLEVRLLRRRGLHIFGFGDAAAAEYGGSGGISVHALVAERFFEAQPVVDEPAVDVLFIGRLSREKGPWVLLEAMRAAHGTGRILRARFVGEGPDLEALRARAAADHLDVTFAGHVAWGAPIVEEMRRARLLVLPSFTEGAPTVLAEAMAVGLPVVAASVGGIPGMVGRPPAARLVQPGDAEELAAALIDCLDHHAIMETLVARGRSRAAGLSITSEARRVADLASGWIRTRTVV